MNVEKNSSISLDNQEAVDIDAMDLLDKVYELALDPMQYENFLDVWEQQISSHFHKDSRRHLLASLDHHRLDQHLRRASHFLDRIDATNNPAACDIFEGIDNQAAFLIDNNLNIVARNKASLNSFHVQEGEPFSAINILESDIKYIEKFLKTAFEKNIAQTRLFVTHSALSQRAIIFYVKISLDCQNQAKTAMIITTNIAWSDHLSSIIRQTFNFTQSELTILKSMAFGRSIKEIAKQRNRSIDTIKTQIKSILKKTNTHSQQELIRITLGMMEIVEQQPEDSDNWNIADDKASALEPVKIHQLQSQDRILEYIILGNIKGKPILFLPLEFGLIRWPAAAEKYTQEHHLKIIIPISPGYGNTTAFSSSESVFNETLLNIMAILDKEEVSCCPVISNGSNSSYALHLAGSCSKQITAVYALAGVLPVTSFRQLKKLHKWHRFILSNARFAPQFFPFVAKGGFKMARSQGKALFFKSIYADSITDIRACNDSGIWEAMMTGSEVAFRDQPSAHRSFAARILAQAQPWPTEPKDITVPITFINGHNDPQVPLVLLREHQQEYSTINFEEIADAGQLIFFENWQPILEKIAREAL